jgi:hypothetical protein
MILPSSRSDKNRIRPRHTVGGRRAGAIPEWARTGCEMIHLEPLFETTTSLGLLARARPELFNQDRLAGLIIT